MTSFLGEFLGLMPNTVAIAAPVSVDRYNPSSYGTPVTYPCRIVGQRKVVTNERGEQVVSQQTIYLGTPDAIDPRSQVTLSTGDVGSTEDYAVHPPILATARYPDEGGWVYSAVYL